jgi:ketosteroid isomerase-like protein
MTDITSTINTYISIWNEAVPERRRALIAEAMTEDISYVDPLMQGAGPDEFDALVAGAQAQFAGHRFVLAGDPDAHHDRVRFTWHLVAAGGDAPVAIGHDYATVAGDGRLRDVTGFLEAVPSQPEVGR